MNFLLILSLLVTAIVLLLTLIYVKLWVLNPIKYKRYDLLPGPPKHWLYGTMHHTRKGSQNFKDHLVLTKKHGGMVRLWRGPLFPIIAIYGAEEAKVILSHSHPKATSYKWVDNWLGDGLLTATTLDGLWKRKRRMITPAFHFNILQRYVPVFGEHAELLVQKWEKEAEKRNIVNIVNDITTSALDIIGQCAFGYNFGALEQGKDQHPYVKAIYSCTDRVYDRAFRPWLYPKFTFERSAIGKEYLYSCKVIHDFATSVIEERRALWATEEGRAELESRKKLDFVDILLTATDEKGNTLTDQEIRDECNTFIFEGHDTTSAALGWTLYKIYTHPEVEKKCLEEIQEVLGDKRYPEFEDMAKLQYLELCIKEGLRLYPSVPTIARYMVEDTEVNGHIIPKGADVYVHPYVIHRQVEQWEDPEEYIPERHTAENSKDRHAFAFVPFSAGPRK